MNDRPWRRGELIAAIRDQIWRYLTPAASLEQELLEAAALLQLNPGELHTLGRQQFLASDELAAMLTQLPSLLRRLATTTAHEEERSSDRVRGPIQWTTTLGLRYATGDTNVYVTAPARRAYQTPENELLVFLLDETVSLGKRTGWAHSTSPTLGQLINDRVTEAEHWRQSRMLLQVQRRPITPTRLARIRSGRHKRRYEPALDVWDAYQDLIGRLDRRAIRERVENHALISRDDPTLFELYATFAILDTLSNHGWQLDRLGLFQGSLTLTGRYQHRTITITYQALPRHLKRHSSYRTIQHHHGIKPQLLRPDLVIHEATHHGDRWLLIEVKGGHRSVIDSARAALHDLLAYRTDYQQALNRSHPYGLGIAWGTDLKPDPSSPVMLCTPDTIPEALDHLLHESN